MTFTPQPEQPVINSLLASGSGGREFNHVVGNYTQTVTDASVSAVGPPLTATRTYNSLDPRADGMFGAGWSTRWDMRIVDESHTQTLLVTYPDGSQMRFGAHRPTGSRRCRDPGRRQSPCSPAGRRRRGRRRRR
jgi:hypothetical protein